MAERMEMEEFTSTSIKDQISKSENTLIKGTLELYRDYFVPKLDNIVQKTYIQGNKVDNTFIKLLIDDSEELKTGLNYVQEYIAANTEELKDQIKPFGDLVANLLNECVESENCDSLRIVLNWFEMDDQDLQRLTKFRQRIDDDFKKNNHAMIRACEKNNFEMVLAFFKHEFKIDALYFKQVGSDSPMVSKNQKKSKFPLSLRKFDKQSMDDVLSHFKHFQATTKPAFMIAQLRFKIDDYDDYDKEIDDYEDIDANPIQDDIEFEVLGFQYEDPVTESFHNVFIAKSQYQDHVEYENKFKLIVKENEQFSVKMLDLCKTSQEAELFLATALRKKQFFAQTHLDIMVYPRLEVAIMNRNIDFVAHDFCQQILREKLMQSQETGEVLPWNSSNWIDRGMYILGCGFMLPIFIACKLGRDISSCCCSASNTCGSDLENSGDGDPVQRRLPSRVVTFFTFPLNRYIAQSISSIVFLCLLTTMVLDENCTLRPYIIVFTFAHIVTDIDRCFQNVKGNAVRFWDIYSIITDFLLLSGCSLGVAKDYTTERPWMNQLETCMTGIGITLAITKLFYWCQLSSWLGPLAISIKKVFRDILMVGTAYVVFYLAFSVGIHFIMSVPVPVGTKNCTDPETYNRFSVFLTKKSSDGALKTAFWSIFDPGHPEYLGCDYGFARTTALTLWGAYQIVNITILINLLVALMNNTMAQINKDKENQWKFYRTEIWLRFINDTSLCPPFNLLDPLVNLLKCKSEEQKQARKKEKNVENSKYINLVSRLSRRYLNHIEDSDANDANREDLENTKRELMNNLRRKKTQ